MTEHSSRPRAAVATAARWTAHQGRRLRGGVRAAPDRLAEHVRRARVQARETWADRARRRRLIRTTAVMTTIAVAVAAFFALFDWNWFRGPLAGYLSARTAREVRIAGDLDVHLFSLKPSASVGGLSIGHPRWLNREGRTADLGQTTVQVKLLPLLVGRVELPLVSIDRPRFDLYSDARGRNNWTFGPKTDTPARLPPIEHFLLNEGRISLRDIKRRLRFEGVVTTSEGTAPGAGFRLEGRGVLNDAPFTAFIRGGPLIYVKRDRPYDFHADVRAGATRVHATGQVVRPFDLGQVRGTGTVSGADLADLYQLTGVVLPNTPPYRLAGRFERDDERYVIRGLDGRVGDSDLAGELTVDKVNDRRFLRGDLRSRVLDFDDIYALMGGAPDPTETASSAQKAIGQKMAAEQRILPDAPLYTERVRAMDADVRYRAAAIRDSGMPLRSGSMHLTLDRGLLRIDALTLTFPRGQGRGWVRLNARGDTPVTDLDFKVDNLRIEDFAPKVQGQGVLSAPLEGAVRLRGVGDSMRKAAASSNGTVAVVMTQGQIRQALAELMGVNVVPGLFQLLSKDPKQTDLRCGVGVFQVTGGVARAERFVFDTGVVALGGQGTIDLRTERVNLTLKGKSKKPRLVRAIVPFHVRGSLAQPRFRADVGPAVAQAGAGLALGALLSPVAAILPFLSPGGAKDADCAGLLAQARAAGAPVNVAAARPTAPGRG